MIADKQQTQPLTNRRGAPLTALIVEDETYVALILRDALEDLGCQVTGWALSSSDAERLARSTPPDVAFVDIRIKGELDGFATAALLRQQHDLATVFVTGLADERTMQQARAVDRAALVRKPFSLGDIHQAILTVCGKPPAG